MPDNPKHARQQVIIIIIIIIIILDSELLQSITHASIPKGACNARFHYRQLLRLFLICEIGPLLPRNETGSKFQSFCSAHFRIIHILK